MSSTTIEPIATAIGSVAISRAVAADLDDVLDLLNETARWLTARGINQWIDGFPRDLIDDNISHGEVYVARLGRRVVGTFTLMWRDELFWPGTVHAAGYIHRLAVRREARGLASSCSSWPSASLPRRAASCFASTVFRGTTRFAAITRPRDSCASRTSSRMAATMPPCPNPPAALSPAGTKNR